MAAVNAAAGIVDPTKTGKYPVILSDALLGKSAKEIYTGVRYNHKPTLSSSDTATPASARLKPSPSQDGAFDLSFADDSGGRYAYAGSRSSTPDSSNGSSPFVLIFDPARQAFVLHRVDSVFNMNLTKTPTNSDPDTLREEFPHLNSTIKVQVGGSGGSSSSNAGKSTSATGSSASAAAKSKPGGEKSGMKALAKLKDREAKAKKADKERKEPPAPISVPESAAKTEKAAKRRDRSLDSDEDEDDDDDGGLLIEYPEGEAPVASRFNQTTDFSPAFPVIPRRFSEFVRDGGDDDQDDDADGEEEFDMPEVPEDDDDEEEDEPMSTFKLPSPVGQQNQQQAAADDDEDIEDLEAALEKEFAMDSESSVSEED